MVDSALLSDGRADNFYHSPGDPATWEDVKTADVEKVVGQSIVKISTTRNDPAWISYGADELNRISVLPENWDSYGACSVSQKVLEQAFRVYLISTQNKSEPQYPRFRATPDGGVDLIWYHNSKGLEISITGALRARAYFYDDNADIDWSRDVTMNDEHIDSYLDQVFA